MQQRNAHLTVNESAPRWNSIGFVRPWLAVGLQSIPGSVVLAQGHSQMTPTAPVTQKARSTHSPPHSISKPKTLKHSLFLGGGNSWL